MSRDDAAVPLHESIYRRLLSQIVAGEFAPHARVPTERVLCDEFQTSRPTVAKAINRLVTEGFLVRRAGSGTYVAERSAPDAGATTARQIALLSSAYDDARNMRTLRGIVETLADAYGRCFSLFDTGGTEVGEAQALERIAEQARAGELRGFIGTPLSPFTNRGGYEQVAATGCAMVLMDRWFSGVAGDFVSTDNMAAAEAATRALLTQGHRRIGYLSAVWFPNRVQTDRRMGYEYALSAALPTATPLSAATRDVNDAEATLAEWFASPDPPTAFVAGSDSAYQRLLVALRRLDRRPGRDVAVAGFSDEEWVRYEDEAFLIVQQQREEIGRCAANLLRERLGGTLSPEAPPRTLLLPARLVYYPSEARWHHPSPTSTAQPEAAPTSPISDPMEVRK